MLHRMLWLTLGILLVAGLTACNFTFDDEASFTSSPEISTPGSTPNATDTLDMPFVRIDSPAPTGDGSLPIVEVDSFTVSGEQFGSFENNVVVEVHSADGMVLDQTAVTATGDMGTIGTWQTTLSPDATPGSTGVIYAYFTSARDGSVVAEDQIAVAFGAAAE